MITKTMAKNYKKAVVVPCFINSLVNHKLTLRKNKSNSLPSAKENTIGVNIMVKMQEHRLQ